MIRESIAGIFRGLTAGSKNKRQKRIVLCLAAAVCSLSACSLASKEGTQLYSEDELIGLYVTNQYIDIARDVEPQRLYGELDAQANEVTFEGTEGYFLLYVTLPMEDGEGDCTTYITSGQFYDISSEVKDGDISVKAQIAFYSSGKEVFYVNPVYRTQNGQIYLVSGAGMAATASSPSEVTYRTDAENTINGRSDSTSREFTLAIQYKAPLQTAVFTQMSAEGETLKRDEFGFEKLPQQYVREDETAYTLVEQRDVLGNTVYDVINREDSAYQLFGSQGGLTVRPFDMEIR